MSEINTNLLNKYGFEYPFSPDPFAIKALGYLKNGKNLLDVGCGEGADSVFYARNGFNVIALDHNEIYLSRLQAYIDDNELPNISVKNVDVVHYDYPENYYDVINCLLVGCCMMRSEFEKLVMVLKETVNENGVIIMSLRNYLDPEFKDYMATEEMIEPNTFTKRDDCCKISYFIEKNRLQESFVEFEILFYNEGYARDKYGEAQQVGESYIICKKN